VTILEPNRGYTEASMTTTEQQKWPSTIPEGGKLTIYEVLDYRLRINIHTAVQKREAVRETEKTWLTDDDRNNRMLKAEVGQKYFYTEQEAWQFVASRLEEEIKSLNAQAHMKRTALGEVEGKIKKL